MVLYHDDVIKWKHFPRNWPFVRGIHRSPVNFPHKEQWCRALMFSLICVWMNDWVNNREAGDLRRYRAHYDVIVMCRGIVGQHNVAPDWTDIWLKCQVSIVIFRTIFLTIACVFCICWFMGLVNVTFGAYFTSMFWDDCRKYSLRYVPCIFHWR